MNLFSSVLCTAFSPTLLLGVGVVIWSAFTVLTPASATVSVPTLLACRAAMGAAEGICLPSIQALIANWVSPEERSRAVAFVFTGLTLGTLGALYLAPALVSGFGWPSVFLVFGASGFLWLAGWLPVAKDLPESQKECLPYECE